MTTNEAAVSRVAMFEQNIRHSGAGAVLETLFNRYDESKLATEAWPTILHKFPDLLQCSKTRCRDHAPRTVSRLQVVQAEQNPTDGELHDWVKAYLPALHTVLGRAGVAIRIEVTFENNLQIIRERVRVNAQKYGYRPGNDPIDEAIGDATQCLLDDPFRVLLMMAREANPEQGWWMVNSSFNALKRSVTAEKKFRDVLGVPLLYDPKVAGGSEPVVENVIVKEQWAQLSESDRQLLEARQSVSDVSELARQFEVSLATMYRWLAALRQKIQHDRSGQIPDNPAR
ncbi:MAG: hypothetical protein K8U57_29790 [Planctomycetes bacterium]|nr:hypothetical protein [Planctomycetota bacterium]